MSLPLTASSGSVMVMTDGVSVEGGGAAKVRSKLWPEWIARCRTQVAGAIAALAAEPWPEDGRLDQAGITTACMLRYMQISDPDLLPPGRYPALDALSARCEARLEFQATNPQALVYHKGE